MHKFDPLAKILQLPWKTSVMVMLPLVGYAIFSVEAVFARPNPVWALLLLLWALGASALSWWLASGKGERGLSIIDRHARPIVWALIGTTAVMLLTISIIQSLFFALGAHAEDTAYYNQILWNTLHGNFLAGNVQQERLYHPPPSNDLALHVSPVLFGILPLYALFPHHLTLLIIRNVALAAAAWPLFLCVRERMGDTAGIVAVVLYLANPAVIAQGGEAFYLLQLAPLPFFGAFRAFVREEFGEFLVWMGLAMSMREDVAIAMAGFGLWALIQGRHRQLRWVGAGLGMPMVWWGVTTLLIQPAFGRWGNSAFDVALAGGAHTPWGTYQTLVGNTSWILDELREGGLEYVYRLLRAVAFLGVLGGEGLIAAPNVVANLFLARAFYSGIDPFSRFALLPSCALIGATVVIVSRIAQAPHCDRRVFAVAVLFLLPSVSLLDGAKDAIQVRLGSYTVRNDAAVLREAIASIPDDASVAAPNYALPALASRSKLFYVQYLHMYPQAQPDYILLDHNRDRMPAHPELRERYMALLNILPQSADYETVWQQGEYFLLHRVGHKP
jgi:hypothetical protein